MRLGCQNQLNVIKIRVSAKNNSIPSIANSSVSGSNRRCPTVRKNNSEISPPPNVFFHCYFHQSFLGMLTALSHVLNSDSFGKTTLVLVVVNLPPPSAKHQWHLRGFLHILPFPILISCTPVLILGNPVLIFGTHVLMSGTLVTPAYSSDLRDPSHASLLLRSALWCL